ncbi:MAG TPA: hypothetical protein GXZ27_02965 [Thermoanaerobacterales bacterium]|nr:hypothetical protein [Thermoanaerobacterales bacterium]
MKGRRRNNYFRFSDYDWMVCDDKKQIGNPNGRKQYKKTILELKKHVLIKILFQTSIIKS